MVATRADQSPFATAALALRKRARLSAVPRIIAAVLLFAAVGQHSGDYFSLLRWFVFGTATLTAILAYCQSRLAWCWVAGMIMVLFNPFVRIRLTAPTWYISILLPAVGFYFR